MKKSIIYWFFLALLVMIGCTNEDFILEKLESLEGRVDKLEQLCQQMNDNMVSLQVMTKALQEKDYITSVTEISDGVSVVGYTVNFSKNGSIAIYHGRDGHTPSVGVRKDLDGLYYWTIDGEWLVDGGEPKIRNYHPIHD